MTPAVSIMMLVYNTERYVGDAVRSILGQTHGDFELIVIDDGSTDRSPEILRGFAAEDGRIRLVSRPNRGIAASRNEALALSRGRYVAVMDSDDVSRPDRIAKQVGYLDANPDCVLVCCQMRLIDSDGWPIGLVNLQSTHEELEAANMGVGGFFVGVPCMMRREALVAVGGYREQFALAEDLDLYLRLAERGRLASIAEPLYDYRQHVASVCRNRPEELTRCLERAIAEARERRGLPAADPATVRRFSPQTRAETHRTWAWWALREGNVATARKHAVASLVSGPFAAETWRLLYCATRGR